MADVVIALSDSALDYKVTKGTISLVSSPDNLAAMNEDGGAEPSRAEPSRAEPSRGKPKDNYGVGEYLYNLMNKIAIEILLLYLLSLY